MKGYKDRKVEERDRLLSGLNWQQFMEAITIQWQKAFQNIKQESRLKWVIVPISPFEEERDILLVIARESLN